MSGRKLAAAIAAEKGFKETVPRQFVDVVKVSNGSETPVAVILTITSERQQIRPLAYNHASRRTASWLLMPFMIEAAKFDLVQLHFDRLFKEVTGA